MHIWILWQVEVSTQITSWQLNWYTLCCISFTQSRSYQEVGIIGVHSAIIIGTWVKWSLKFSTSRKACTYYLTNDICLYIVRTYKLVVQRNHIFNSKWILHCTITCQTSWQTWFLTFFTCCDDSISTTSIHLRSVTLIVHQCTYNLNIIIYFHIHITIVHWFNAISL